MRWGSMCAQQLGLPVFWSVPVHTTRKALLLTNLPSPYLRNCPHALLSALWGAEMEQDFEILEQED